MAPSMFNIRRPVQLWQAYDVRRPTLSRDVLRRLPVTSVKHAFAADTLAAGAAFGLVIIDTSV